jgi:hypothetical protein
MKLLTSTALFLLLISLASVSYSQVSSLEREALIAFYNATDGVNWTGAGLNQGWLGDAGTECDWVRKSFHLPCFPICRIVCKNPSSRNI